MSDEFPSGDVTDDFGGFTFDDLMGDPWWNPSEEIPWSMVPTLDAATLEGIQNTISATIAEGLGGFNTDFDPTIPEIDTTDPWDTPFPDDAYVVTDADKGYTSPDPAYDDQGLINIGGEYNGPVYGPSFPSGDSGSTGSVGVIPTISGPDSDPYAVPDTSENTDDSNAIVLGGIPDISEPPPDETTDDGTISIIPLPDFSDPDSGGDTPVVPTISGPDSDPYAVPNTSEPPPSEPPPVIPTLGDTPVAEIDWGQIASGVGAAATAIGGAVNVQNQFDFLENSAEDQILANRNAAVDTGIMQNPDFYNPYGSQTNTGGTIGPDGQIIRPTVTQALSPEQQQLFDTEQQTKQALGDISQTQVGRVGEQFGTEFDTSGFTGRYKPTEEGLTPFSQIDLNQLSARNTQPGVTGRNTITDAMIQREQPRFDRAEEQMRNNLLIQGFNPGTEGFTEQTDEFGRAKNDFNLAAQAAGAQEQSRLFGLESAQRGQQLNEQQANLQGNLANRGQRVDEQLDYGGFASDERAREFQEAMATRNMPLNELNALRTGNQATLPQFQQYQGGQVGAPDYQALGVNQANLSGDVANQFFDLSKGALSQFGWGS